MITKNRLFLLLTLITTGITLNGMQEEQSIIDPQLPIEKAIESNATEENIDNNKLSEQTNNEDTPQNEHSVQETIANPTNTADESPKRYQPKIKNELLPNATEKTTPPISQTVDTVQDNQSVTPTVNMEEVKTVVDEEFSKLSEKTKDAINKAWDALPESEEAHVNYTNWDDFKKAQIEIKKDWEALWSKLLPNATEKTTSSICQTVDTVQDNQTVPTTLNMEEVKTVVDGELAKLSEKEITAINKGLDALPKSKEARFNHINNLLPSIPPSLQEEVLKESAEETFKRMEERFLLLDENERRNILNNWPEFVQKLNEGLLLFEKPSQKQQEQLPIIQERVRSALERSLEQSTQNVLDNNNPEKPVDTVLATNKSSFFEKMCYIGLLKGLFKEYENRSFVGSVSQADALRFTLALTGLTTVSYGCYKFYEKRKAIKKWLLQNPLVHYVIQAMGA